MTREEAIRDIKECVMPYVGGISLQMAIDDMTEMDRLSKATPVLKEPERPHGEWIRNDNGTYSCSICQSWIPKEQHYYARYCLHCGRVMKEGE